MFGTVTKYFNDKGYGFIRGQDGKSYFIFLNAFEETISEVLESGDYVNLHDFGSFDTVLRKGCKVIPPTKKEPMYVPDKLKVKFTPYKKLKEKVCNK